MTGTAGSGKTTTLASMIDHINSTREGHIVTIEDPIEVLHQDKKCIVNQREIGIDTESYADALRHVVRQDPDVILIGEMRDHETVSAALTAAEIGNLVLSTLHTIDATETINRIIDFFPPYQQQADPPHAGGDAQGHHLDAADPVDPGRARPGGRGARHDRHRPRVHHRSRQDVPHPRRDGGGRVLRHADVRPVAARACTSDRKITLDDAIAMAHNAHDFKIKVRQLGIDPSDGGADAASTRRVVDRRASLRASATSASHAPASAPMVSSTQS